MECVPASICDPSPFHIAEVLSQSGFRRSESTLLGDFAGFVQNAVVTPLVAQINTDRLRTLGWFLLRRLFLGGSG
jgi:hypothetical protein